MKEKEKILCDDCAHNMIRNLAWGLNSYVCKSCEKRWKISGAIPITHGEYAKRDLTDRLMELLHAAERGDTAPRQAPNARADLAPAPGAKSSDLLGRPNYRRRTNESCKRNGLW